MTSVLNVDTIADKAGTGPVGLTKQVAPKCWVHADHSGDTIPDSFNLSSINDDGTGLKDYNWTSSFVNVHYSGTNGMGGNEGTTTNGRLSSVNGTWTTSQAIIKFSQSSSTGADDVNAMTIFIGDLA